MKKLINSPDDVIAEALKGIGAADQNVRVDHDNRVIFRASPDPPRAHPPREGRGDLRGWLRP